MTSDLNITSLLDPSLVSELKRIELRTRRSIDANLMGRYRSAFRGRGLVYSDIREYLPGDDVKNIHWKVTARTSKVYVKSYDEDRQLNVILAVDISNSTNFGAPKTKHTRALEFAALVSLLAYKAEDAIGLCLFSQDVEEFFPPKRTRTQFQRVLLSLLRHRELGKDTNIAPALEYLKKHQRRPSIIFLISDFFSPPFKDALRSLAFKHDIVCVRMADLVDTEVPPVGIVEYFDAETGERHLIDTSSKRVQRKLAALEANRRTELQEQCLASNIDLIDLQENPLRPLARLMEMRTGRLR